MDISGIESMIADTCGNEHTADDLQELLSIVAERLNASPAESDLDNGARFVLGYIEQVPYMLKVAITAAANVGLESEMAHILYTVTQYWEQDEDIIPDHLGIIGLLDDAYCSLTTLQAFSDHYRLQTGKHMFPDDLSAANSMMRQIIGEPYAGQLDQFVADTIGEADIMNAVRAMASEDKQIHLAARANIWNHGPAGEMPVDQLAGLGLTAAPRTPDA
ncbi:DUF1232 domain-containing protein [Marinihelvus fidelis]|uniref:DUF1232 domain-containing protein n=1 Tax=Marinihelvus fidelis TaxID=2613842 RepID=A0A5N0TFQ1_9GAMM|nr:DUF1232 domain-containing protein [Marinihelvus fidelis]KAA9132089.1 DUF1232 domain-containing protein [Marinihelvus fidelis]